MSNTNEDKRSSHKDFKNLLDQLQMESWQLELIISGVAIFAVWELKSVVGSLREFSIIHGQSSQAISFTVGVLGLGMTVAWIVLFINLIVHIFSRGLWIGVIGLRYVSEDIDFKSLDYAPKFDVFLRTKIGAFDDYIEKLERFSSILFAYTFFLIFLLISFSAFVGFCSIFISIIDYFEFGNLGLGIFAMFIFLGALIVFFDFIFLGAIKKVRDKTISTIYFWMYRFFSFITLSFLYRPLLYNFIDDKYAKKFFLFSIPYFLIIFFFSGIILNPSLHFPFRSETFTHDTVETAALSFAPIYYDDERAHLRRDLFGSKYGINRISLPSKIITKNYGQVFLRMYHKDQIYFENKKGISSYDKKGFLHDTRGASNKEEDLIQTTIKSERDSVIKLHILEKVAVIKKMRNGLLTQQILGTKMMDENIVLDTLFWKNKRDSIKQVWDKKIKKAKGEKVSNIRDAMLELNEITIDDIPYNDSLSCKFYIHPSLGERGLLCFFSTKNLQDGPHLMELERKVFTNRIRLNKDNIEVDTIQRIIPFYIYKD